jgi:hypothetical protein
VDAGLSGIHLMDEEKALFLKGEGLELLLTLSHEEGLSLAFVVACKRMS